MHYRVVLNDHAVEESAHSVEATHVQSCERDTV